MLALLLRFAAPTIQVQSQRQFPPRSSLVKRNLSLVLMPATTICGRDSRPPPSITSILLGMVLLMLANGATHRNPLATTLQSTLALVQRMASPGFLLWRTSQRPRHHTQVPSRSRATFLALASTRMVNSALLQDAMETAARSVISLPYQSILNANSFYRCLSSLAQPRMLSPKRNCIRHDRFLEFLDSRHLVHKLFCFFVLMFSLRYLEASDGERTSTLWSGQFDHGSSSCLQVKGKLVHITDTPTICSRFGNVLPLWLPARYPNLSIVYILAVRVINPDSWYGWSARARALRWIRLGSLILPCRSLTQGI